MTQKNLGKLYPKIEGDGDYGFKYASFISTDTAFAASAGLSGVAVAGQIRFDTSDLQLKFWNGSAEVAIAAASAAGTGLDGNYDINKTITIDAGPIIMSGSSTDDHLQIATSGAVASGKSLIDLVLTGTPNVDSNMLRFDVSGATTTGVPTLLEVVGAGKTVQGIYVDTDITSKHAVHFHGGGALTNGLGVVGISSDGALATGGNLLNITYTGTPAATTVCALEILCAKDCQAMAIATSAATQSGILITGSGATANDTAVVEINWGASTPANAGANLLRLDASGIDATVKPVILEVFDNSVSTAASFISLPTANDCVIIQGDGAMTDGNAALAVSGSGAIAAGGCVAELILDGSSPDTDARVLEVMAGAKDVRGIYVDTASATNDGVYILNDGALAAGKAAVKIDINGDINATANALFVESTGATATNNAYLVKFDTNSKDAGALYIDSDGATDSPVHIHGGGALASDQAMLEITSDGTPANAGSNLLRLDVTSADNTIVPIVMEIVGAGDTAQAIYSDVDITSRHAHHFHCGGALTNGLGVVGITNDGTLGTGANLLNVTMGATPHAAAIAVEIVSAYDCQALTVATSAATASAVLITGSGATADNTAVFEVNWGASTPVAAGSNLVRIDGSGATNTIKPVLLEVYDDSVAVGLSVSTASIEDMVTLIGMGNTGTDKAILDVTWGAITPAATSNMVRLDASAATTTSKPILLEVYDDSVAAGAVIQTASIEDVVAIIGTGAIGSDKAVLDVTGTGTLNVGGNLVRIDGTGGTTTSKPVLLEVLDDSVATAASFTSLPTANHVVLVAAGGAMTDGYAGLAVTSSGALATGGAAEAIIISGSPTNDSRALEIDAQKDMRAVYIDTDAVTNNAVEITAGAAIATGKAALAITNTGAPATGSYLVDLTSGANFATSTTSYLLHLDAAHTGVEGLHVDAGTVLIDETLTVTAGAEITADAGIGNWTVDACTVTSDGSGTGVIPDNVNCVQLTSLNSDYFAVLPTPTPGKEVWIIADATSGCELRSSASATVSINNSAGSASELTISADTTYHALCITATDWIIEKYSNAGTQSSAGTVD